MAETIADVTALVSAVLTTLGLGVAIGFYWMGRSDG